MNIFLIILCAVSAYILIVFTLMIHAAFKGDKQLSMSFSINISKEGIKKED